MMGYGVAEAARTGRLGGHTLAELAAVPPSRFAAALSGRA